MRCQIAATPNRIGEPYAEQDAECHTPGDASIGHAVRHLEKDDGYVGRDTSRQRNRSSDYQSGSDIEETWIVFAMKGYAVQRRRCHQQKYREGHCTRPAAWRYSMDSGSCWNENVQTNWKPRSAWPPGMITLASVSICSIFIRRGVLA